MILINDRPLNVTTFPNGEKKMQFAPISKCTICVKFKWETDADFMELYFLSKQLKKLHREAYLHIMYLPYSRMDRQMGEDFFTLKDICQFINSLGFISVYVNEPHSDVSLALLDNAIGMKTTVRLFEEWAPVITDDDNITLCYPDAGAQKRYHQPNYRYVVGEKQRHPQTGKIAHYAIHGKVYTGESIIILDDLCCYGGTFILAAEQLKAQGAGDIYLIVAHCEESILKGELLHSGLIKRVFTTNSIINQRFATNKLVIKGVI